MGDPKPNSFKAHLKTDPRVLSLGIILGLIYGLFWRYVFGLQGDDGFFAVMSTGFIFGVPIALGFLTVWFASRQSSVHLSVTILLPWTSSLAFLLATLLLAWEGLICIVLWLPITLIFSTIGGITAAITNALIKNYRQRTYCAAFFLFLPLYFSAIGSLKERSTQIRTVESSIYIEASPEEVWNQIKSVPLIQEGEHFPDIVHVLGFPRPLSAELTGEGIGAIRNATFEGSVLFVETVTEWIPSEKISFTIDADPENIPPETFDEHVTIGGPYFDVLQGTYKIERQPDGGIVLHLSSEQRLSTGFNFYSHLWTEWLMHRIQLYILKIIKTRAEQNAVIES